MKKDKIAILSTVYNFELYAKTSKYFPNDIQKYCIDGRDGMYGMDSIIYMMKKLNSKPIKWLIMADEDVVFVNPNLVFDIIDEMERKKYFFSGVRDGGVIKHRNQNPYVINTFFSIINFDELKKIWDKKIVLKNQYIRLNEFNDDLTQLKYDFNKTSLYEPYYRFYLWLRRQGKSPLFLETETLDDNISNSVNFNKETLLYHTWYARSYGVNEKHTQRIDKILALNKDINFSEINNQIIFKDRYFKFFSIFKKYAQKVKMKLRF